MMGPVLFGRPSMPTSSTPLDHKIPADDPTTLTGVFNSLRDVNTWVNQTITYCRDEAGDWQSPGTTMQLKTGDCEDFALLKRAALIENNLARPEDIYLVVGYDKALRTHHALLVVRVGGENLVLDNLASKVLPDSCFTDFRPIFSYSGDRRWVHGRAA